MKRRSMSAILFITVGGVVNVAVAWGLLAFAPITAFGTERDTSHWYSFAERFDLQPVRYPATFRLNSEWSSEGSGFSISKVDYQPILFGGIPILGAGTFLVYRSCGFPLPALHGWVFEHAEYCHCVRLEGHRAREPGPFSSQTDACLPLRPMWPGFLINTILYALILWLLFAAPFALRRRRRRRRGLCEQCAYPIGVSPVCTECGASVARRSKA